MESVFLQKELHEFIFFFLLYLSFFFFFSKIEVWAPCISFSYKFPGIYFLCLLGF